MADLLANIRFMNPLPIIARITSRLGDPRSYGEHEGYDFAAPTGTSILAAARGTVARSGYMADGYGYYVELDHGSGVKTLYGHMMSSPLVSKGATVSAGQTLGFVGATGYATGPHLHFHIQANGIYQDVAQYVDLAVTGVGAGLEGISNQIIDATRTLRQQGEDEYCFTQLWLGGSAADYAACIEERTGSPPDQAAMEAARLLDETPLVEQEREGILAFLEGEGPIADVSGISEWWDAAKTDIEDLIYNIVFAPARAIVITFKLSDLNPKDGRATLEWLEAEKNTTLLITSIAIALLVILLIIVAVNSFLLESKSPISTTAKLIESPITTAAEALGK